MSGRDWANDLDVGDGVATGGAREAKGCGGVAKSCGGLAKGCGVVVFGGGGVATGCGLRRSCRAMANACAHHGVAVGCGPARRKGSRDVA